MSAADINKLLEDHLFQVIGSTPKSVMNSLKKVELKDKTREGAYLLSVAIFSAAVNKPTMESFLAKPEFANVRPMINAALSIQGRANMTAFTLLGHCILTTEFAKDIVFAREFRNKLGQDHLWAGNLESGSLSEKQKTILKEKRRQTSETEAKLLGSGYLKWTGIVKRSMTRDESTFWDITLEETFPGAGSSFRRSPVTPPRTIQASVRQPAITIVDVNFEAMNGQHFMVPSDVLAYRRVNMKQSDRDISDSLTRNGLDLFISRTRTMIAADPEGKQAQMATSI
jgi:hypothetical protein